MFDGLNKVLFQSITTDSINELLKQQHVDARTCVREAIRAEKCEWNECLASVFQSMRSTSKDSWVAMRTHKKDECPITNRELQ